MKTSQFSQARHDHLREKKNSCTKFLYNNLSRYLSRTTVKALVGVFLYFCNKLHEFCVFSTHLAGIRTAEEPKTKTVSYKEYLSCSSPSLTGTALNRQCSM